MKDCKNLGGGGCWANWTYGLGYSTCSFPIIYNIINFIKCLYCYDKLY
jgi:hypothetical protein